MRNNNEEKAGATRSDSGRIKGQSASSDPAFPAGHGTPFGKPVLATRALMILIGGKASHYSIPRALIAWTVIPEKEAIIIGPSRFLSGRFPRIISSGIHRVNPSIFRPMLHQPHHPEPDSKPSCAAPSRPFRRYCP